MFCEGELQPSPYLFCSSCSCDLSAKFCVMLEVTNSSKEPIDLCSPVICYMIAGDHRDTLVFNHCSLQQTRSSIAVPKLGFT